MPMLKIPCESASEDLHSTTEDTEDPLSIGCEIDPGVRSLLCNPVSPVVRNSDRFRHVWFFQKQKGRFALPSLRSNGFVLLFRRIQFHPVTRVHIVECKDDHG